MTIVLILRSEANFDESVLRARTILREWVFKDVEIGEFTIVEAAYGTELGEIVAASGKAVDRTDLRPVNFRVLRVGRVDLNLAATGAAQHTAGQVVICRRYFPLNACRDRAV